MIEINRDKLVQSLIEISKIGADSDSGISRLALSDEDARARQWFEEQLEKLDMDYRIDQFGNIFGRMEGQDSTAGPILIGSHLDTQPQGGIYDGQLGICAALGFLHALRDSNRVPHRPIEIVNWTNEEGSRFQPPMQGSGVWAGNYDIEEEYTKTDTDGKRLKEELDRIGYLGSTPCQPHEDYSAYLELHIEQGPYLDTKEKDVGIVTGIVGQSWGEIILSGEADHSGPTATHLRSDALVPAADIIISARRISETAGERTVGTVGSMNVKPESPNIIPGKVEMTWEFRDPDDSIVERAQKQLKLEASTAAKREGVDCQFDEHTHISSVDFSDRVIAEVEKATEKLGYESMKLVSGAGHDASHAADICDTGMVFAVSEDGKSHTPAEYTNWDDCYKSAATFANAAIQLADTS